MAVSKQLPYLSSFSIFITVDIKPAQIRIVSFVIITSDRNNSVKILNHWTSVLPDISASFLKSNYAKLLARSIFQLLNLIGIYMCLRVFAPLDT